MAEEDYYQFDNENVEANGREEERKKKEKKRKKKLVKDSCCHAEEEFQFQENNSGGKAVAESVKGKKRKHLLKEKVESDDKGAASNRGECDDGLDEGNLDEEAVENVECGDEREEKKRSKRKRRLLEEAAEADKRGVCYLSRIPPHMNPFNLRQLLSQFGDIQRIYLAPKNPAAQVRRKPGGGRRQEQSFSEGWVEFSDKRIAKRVANMLNGEQIGGRKRSSFYYDIWNIKYLSKFKWDDLTEEIAYKSAIREQKLALEISAAKREMNFYLSKVDKARALSSIEERLKKKQKLQEESGMNADNPVSQAPKIVRKFAQKKPIAHNAAEAKPRLSKDILAGVFSGS